MMSPQQVKQACHIGGPLFHFCGLLKKLRDYKAFIKNVLYKKSFIQTQDNLDTRQCVSQVRKNRPCVYLHEPIRATFEPPITQKLLNLHA